VIPNTLEAVSSIRNPRARSTIVTVTHVIWTLEEKDVEKKGGNILDKNK
jgi:hypothetical protein